jgi:hypothetical protein
LLRQIMSIEKLHTAIRGGCKTITTTIQITKNPE